MSLLDSFEASLNKLGACADPAASDTKSALFAHDEALNALFKQLEGGLLTREELDRLDRLTDDSVSKHKRFNGSNDGEGEQQSEPSTDSGNT
jgi:hypothetical protein